MITIMVRLVNSPVELQMDSLKLWRELKRLFPERSPRMMCVLRVTKSEEEVEIDIGAGRSVKRKTGALKTEAD